MTFGPLDQLPISRIAECFIHCFKDYFVAMPQDIQYYKDRWANTSVDFTLSYGVFDGDQLVGCLLNSVRSQGGHLTSYNAGTGIAPEYRGRSLSSRLYSYAMSECKKQGITRCELEVIQENTVALQLYSKLGFNVIADLRCYSGELNTTGQSDQRITSSSLEELLPIMQKYNHEYSWDNQLESIKTDDYQYYMVRAGGNIQSYCIIKPENGYIAQLDVLDSHPKSWKELFNAIASIRTAVKINNTTHVRADKLRAYEIAGLTNVVNQYKMELFL